MIYGGGAINGGRRRRMMEVVAERTGKRSSRAARGGSLVNRGEREDGGRGWNHRSANTCCVSKRTSYWLIHTQQLDSCTAQPRPISVGLHNSTYCNN